MDLTEVELARREELKAKIEAGEIGEEYILQRVGQTLQDLSVTMDGEELPPDVSSEVAETLRQLASIVRIEGLQVRARNRN